MYTEDSSLPNYNCPSLGDCILILIEQIHTSWVETTLGSSESTGLNKKHSEDILESAENNDIVPLVVTFSITGNMA